MDAILLAAGLGMRLRPYTLETPKPLLPIRGRPILDWTLAALPRQIDRVIVVTHHLAEQVESYMESQNHVKEWETVFQAVPRGTGDAFRSCREAIRSERFMVLNGDDLYAAADLERLCHHSAGLLAHPVDEPRRYGVIFRTPDGHLERLVEKPDLDGRMLANIGAYQFPRWSADVELPLSPRGEYEITDAVAAVAAREPVAVVEATAWLPIGTLEAWRHAEELDLRALLGSAAR